MEELQRASVAFWRWTQNVQQDLKNVYTYLGESDRNSAVRYLEYTLRNFSIVRLYACEIMDLIKEEEQEIDIVRFVETVQEFIKTYFEGKDIALILLRLAQECSVYEVCLYYLTLLDDIDLSLGALYGSLNGIYIVSEEDEAESYDFNTCPTSRNIYIPPRSLSGFIYESIQKKVPEAESFMIIQKAFSRLLREFHIVAAIWKEYCKE